MKVRDYSGWNIKGGNKTRIKVRQAMKYFGPSYTFICSKEQAAAFHRKVRVMKFH